MAKHELIVGDIAPQLPKGEYLKGTAVEAFEPGSIYVVECWATWCSPCIDTIPHITELQKRLPNVTFIGIAVWEQSAETVRSFVAEMGDKMGYTVMIDAADEPGSDKGWMPQHWLKPAYVSGIPAAFIVDGSGRVVFIGHPAEMDAVLERVVAGTFDIETERQNYLTSLSDNLVRETSQLQERVQQSLARKDRVSAIKAYDEAFETTPSLEKSFSFAKLILLLHENTEAAIDYAIYLIEKSSAEDSEILQNTGMAIADSIDGGGEFGPPLTAEETGPALAAVLAAGPSSPDLQTLSRLSVEALKKVKAITVSEIDPYSFADIARNTARALLVAGKAQEAFKEAEDALQSGLDFPEGVKQELIDLAQRCKGLIAPVIKKPTVICEGDVCRIV